jgi:hypothetical protein
MPTTDVPDPPSESDRPIRPPSGGSSSSGDDPGVSSSHDGSGADDDVAPTVPAGDAPVKASPLKDLGSRGDTSAARAKLEKTRVADDLKVAKFYMNDGNAKGAYLRYKDAVEHDPIEPEARFGLAEAAAKLNMKEEAVLNYRVYLKLDEGGDHDRQTRNALKGLGSAAQ